MTASAAELVAALVERLERGAWLRPSLDELEAGIAVLRAAPGVEAALRRRKGLRAYDEARASGGTHLEAETVAARRAHVTVWAIRKWRLAREVTKAPISSPRRVDDHGERGR